jgi:hypothetical protein
MFFGHRVQKVGRHNASGHDAFPASGFHQMVQKERQELVRAEQRAIHVHDAKPVGITVGGQPQVRLFLQHGALQALLKSPDRARGCARRKARPGWCGSTSPERPDFIQEFVKVPAAGAPQGIHHHADFPFLQ